MKIINKFWNWYDSIDELYRLLFGLLIVVLAIFVAEFRSIIGSIILILIMGTRINHAIIKETNDRQ